MIASSAALDLIRRFEDCRLISYQDSGGVWTIGWGHTDGVVEGQSISQEMADALLAQDIAEVGADLSRRLGDLQLRQCQFDALASLAYNAGCNIDGYAPHLWACVLAGDRLNAANNFLDIDKAKVNGVLTVLPWLQARRKAEAALFNGRP